MTAETTTPAGRRRFVAPTRSADRPRTGRRLAVQYVIRTDRDLEDTVDAYTALRVALMAEIAHTAATTHDYTDPAIREIDRRRLAEARAQLGRINGALGMLTARRRGPRRRST